MYISLKELGKNISSLRNIKGITQSSLAEKAHVSLPTIQLIESGRGNPSFQNIQNILKVLGLNIKFEEQKNYQTFSQWSDSNEIIDKNEFFKLLVSEINNYKLHRLSNREKDELISCLKAIIDHYPTSLHEKNIFRHVQKLISADLNKQDRNRMIKLRRIWLGKLKDIL